MSSKLLTVRMEDNCRWMCVSSRGAFGSGELNSYEQDFGIIPDKQMYGKSKLENYIHATYSYTK